MISDEKLRELGWSTSTVRLFGPITRIAVVGLLLGFGVQRSLVYAAIAQDTVTLRKMADFDIFYRSSVSVAQGAEDPYTAGMAAAPNLNPPHIVLALVPLTFVTRGWALAIWAAASLCSAFIALWILFRDLRIRATGTAVFVAVLVVLAAAPTGALLYFAQISWLLWAPMMWAWASARGGKWIRAAIVIGFAMSVKPFLLVFVPMFILRRLWIPAAVACASAASCLSIGIVTLGWRTFQSWIHVLTAVSWTDVVFNASLFGFLERLLTNHPRPVWNMAPLIDAPGLVLPLWTAAAGVVSIVSARSIIDRRSDYDTSRDPSSGCRVDRLFAVTLCAAFLMSPVSWIYYLFFVTGPLVGLLRQRGLRAPSRWQNIVLGLAALCFTLSPGTLTLGQPNGLATASIGSSYFWGLVGLWVYAATAICEQDPRADAQATVRVKTS